MTPLLVIGYGNELRGDDGAGPRVARLVAGWNRPGIRGRAVHQLVPELATELATAGRVVFVDAAVDRPGGWRRVQPAVDLSALGHTCDPGWLLALMRELYGRVPEAWLATVPARNLDYTSKLTSAAERDVDLVVRRIAALTEPEA